MYQKKTIKRYLNNASSINYRLSEDGSMYEHIDFVMDFDMSNYKSNDLKSVLGGVIPNYKEIAKCISSIRVYYNSSRDVYNVAFSAEPRNYLNYAYYEKRASNVIKVLRLSNSMEVRKAVTRYVNGLVDKTKVFEHSIRIHNKHKNELT